MAHPRHCSHCHRNRPDRNFSGYDKIPKRLRVEHNIDNVYVCNECLGQSHRPRAIREAAGLAMPRRQSASTEKRPDPPAYHSGLSGKEKRQIKQQQCTVRPPATSAVKPHIESSQPRERSSGEANVTISSTPSTSGHMTTGANDQYPNVLPVGATFIPKGFERGKMTGLVIRMDADPKIPCESPCLNCSAIQGKEIWHPHWDFYRDKNRRAHIRSSCVKTHHMKKSARDAILSTASQEHARQIEEGRRAQFVEAEELRNGSEEAPAPHTTESARESQSVMVVPAQHDIPFDMHVLMPEGFQQRFGARPYLDLKDLPIQVTELHRVGMFLMTQLHEALYAHAELTKLQHRHADLERQIEELRRADRAVDSQLEELHATVGRLTTDLQSERDAHAHTQQQLDQEKEVHQLDSDMLQIAEQSNTNLTAIMQRLEDILRPLLGGRSFTDLLNS